MHQSSEEQVSEGKVTHGDRDVKPDCCEAWQLQP